MKFGMFFLAEFVSTLFMSGFFATVFLGGYRLFGLETLVIGDGWVIGNLLGLIIFFVKMFAVYFVYIWIRGTLPRVRVDQILNFNWKFLVPVSLALVMMTAVLDKLLPDTFNDFARAGAHLLANIILAMITIEILRSYARRQRKLASDDGVTETASAHDDHGHHEPAHEPVAAH